MVLKIYGIIPSPPAQIVYLTLKEIGIPYELIIVNTAEKEQKSPAYIAKQPFGQVPLLEDDDGFIVYESRAIARYLVLKYAPDSGLIPKGVKENALFEQAVSIETSNFTPYVQGIAAEKFFRPNFYGIPTDEAKAAEHQATLEEKLKVYDVILSKQKYVAGDSLTLADIFHIPAAAAAVNHAGYKGLEAFPNVSRWWSELTSRPSYKEVWGSVEEFKAKLKK